MATEDNGNERQSLAERMVEIDGITESPSKRAQKIWEQARKLSDEYGFTTWDLMCFVTEWLGIMVPLWPWLDGPAKDLARRVYYAHYYLTDVVLGTERKAKLGLVEEEDKRVVEVEGVTKPVVTQTIARTEIDL
jgi:hypothetical protein